MEEIEEGVEEEKVNKEEYLKLKQKMKILKECCNILRVEDKDLINVVKRFEKEIEEMESRLRENH